MRRVVKIYLTPGWAGITVLLWGAAVAMVLLGRWQLLVSNRKHFDLQNFGYSLQWWAFAACALTFWAKFVRDAWRRPDEAAPSGGELVVRGGGPAPVGPAELAVRGTDDRAPVVYRGYVMPQSATTPARTQSDPVRSEYNDYLWQLALADAAVPDPGLTVRPPVPRRGDPAPPGQDGLPAAGTPAELEPGQ